MKGVAKGGRAGGRMPPSLDHEAEVLSGRTKAALADASSFLSPADSSDAFRLQHRFPHQILTIFAARQVRRVIIKQVFLGPAFGGP